jgi:integrase
VGPYPDKLRLGFGLRARYSLKELCDEEAPPRIDGRLFPLGPNQTTMLFVRTAKRAGLEDCRLHDLRHTFASYQAMAGVAGRGLQVLLGHKTRG